MDAHLLPVLLVVIALLGRHLEAYVSRLGRWIGRQDEVARRRRGEGVATSWVPQDKEGANLKRRRLGSDPRPADPFLEEAA